MLNIFEMDGKRYILLSDDDIQLFDNWLVDCNLRLAEEEKYLTKHVADVCPDCFGRGQVRHNNVFMPCISCGSHE